jgi:hypothetical protein
VTVGVDAGDPTARLVATLQVHGCAEAFERSRSLTVRLTCSRYMTRPYDFEWA